MKKIKPIHYAQLHARLGYTAKKSRIYLLEALVFTCVLVIFGLKVTGYLHTNIFSPTYWVHTIAREYRSISYKVSELKYFGKCANGQLKINIGQQYLCRDKTAAGTYQRIFDTYSRDVSGKEVIYPYYDELSMQTADDLLKDQYDIPRYKPSTFKPPLTWNEDPYNDEYWRYNFYSMRITKDLLNAAYTTHDSTYAKKLVQIVDSFNTVGSKQAIAWRDPHAVAWRSMTYSDIWWKLRSLNGLPIQTSNDMLAVMEKQGQYLADPVHYEAQYNHGTNEAAALYQLAVSFPTLPHAQEWLQLSKERLGVGLSTIIDSDGALVEHSPYYDYYALVKYWDTYTYSNRFNETISPDYKQKITAMIHYATYLLQPDRRIPIVGSSLKGEIHNSEEYAEMAKFSKQFQYVVTQGEKGKKPAQNSIQFKTTGQSILRSSWNSKPYDNQTQLIFNYGAYITNHSQLDNLSIVLYGAGAQLLTGPGLYTYEKNAYHDYFYGTSSQNTVEVDGQNQAQGTGYATDLVTTKDYSSQSASNQLNPHVTHERQVVMIGDKLTLVIDKLHATDNKTHNYQQLFHIAPQLSYSKSGLTINAKGKTTEQQLTIRQLAPAGISLSDTYNQRDPKDLGGLCSQEYEVLIACHQSSYSQNGTDASFITALQIGPDRKDLTYRYDSASNSIIVESGKKTFTVSLKETSGHNISAKATSVQAPAPQETTIDDFTTLSGWSVTGGSLLPSADTYDPKATAAELTSIAGAQAIANKNVHLDLGNQNLLLRFKLPSAANVDDANLTLYSNTSTATIRLKNTYNSFQDNDTGNTLTLSKSPAEGGWATVSLGKGMQRYQQGQWNIKGNDFNWSAISKLSFVLDSNDGTPAHMVLGKLSTTVGQEQGKVLIVFDDGSRSILPAADYLNSHHLAASVGVIGKYVDRNSQGYLSVEQLKNLKQHNWSLVNHSYFHQDAITEYYDKNNLAGFENDLLLGAQFLNKEGLDTDANWYIYPHGTTNPAIQKIVGKYYKFARSELTAPEVYPFGNPLSVKDFIIQDGTSPDSAIKAIEDAKTYNQTLILTFHRIHSKDTDESGYDLGNFKTIVDALVQSKVNVMSFNQFDASNGTPINKITVTSAQPAQLSGSVEVKNPSLWQRFRSIW